MSIAFELQNVAIGWAAAADPNVSILVHVNSVLGLGPIESFTGSTPGMEEMSLLVELEDWWRSDAAHRTRRGQRGANLIGGVRGGPLQDPDMVVAIHGQAADLPDDPVVWKLLRPGWVNSIFRRVLGVHRRGNCTEQNCRGDAEAEQHNCKFVLETHSVHGALRAKDLSLAKGGRSIGPPLERVNAVAGKEPLDRLRAFGTAAFQSAASVLYSDGHVARRQWENGRCYFPVKLIAGNAHQLSRFMRKEG